MAHHPEDLSLKAAGLKMTTPRMKILKMFLDAKTRHWSAEAIYRAFLEANEEVSLPTVYRVLADFEAAGIVQRHHFEGDRSFFELAETGSHHDHILCIQCGEIQEFVDEVIEGRQKELAARLGYQMTDHRLTLYGICERCR